MMQSATQTRIGLTLKFVLEMDERTARQFRQVSPVRLQIEGAELGAGLRVVAGDESVTPARFWVRVEELPREQVDDFLEE